MEKHERPVEAIAEEIMKIIPVFIRKMHAGIIEQISLTPAQLFILMFLEERQSCRLVDISQEMKIAPPTATGIIDRLVKNGYVQKEHDLQDRRAVKISLAQKGVDFLGGMRQTKYERTCKILRTLTPDDREHYVRILKKLLEGMEHV